jgi:hypothetical protein
VGKGRNAYKILVSKRKGNGPVERCRRRLEGKVKVDSKQIVCEHVNSVNFVHDMIHWKDELSGFSLGIFLNWSDYQLSKRNSVPWNLLCHSVSTEEFSCLRFVSHSSGIEKPWPISRQ